MSLENLKIKLVHNKNRSDMDFPLYTVSYKANFKRPNYPSYEVLSAFVGQSDVFIELSTDLIVGLQADAHDYVKEYLDTVNSTFNLEYCSRKVPSAQKPSILGFIYQPKKKVEAAELIFHVPNHIWTDEKFKDYVPVNGAKYYIAKEPAEDGINAEGGNNSENGSILNSIWNRTDEEKADAFKLILHNYAMYGNIGVIVSSLDENELRGLLGLKKEAH